MDATRERDATSLVPVATADDRADFCSECGRAWCAAPDVDRARAAPGPRWPGLLLAMGIYLLIAYGPRAGTSVAVPGIKPALLPVVPCWMSGAGHSYADCDPTKARVGAALGLAWSFVGLGATTRQAARWRRRRSRRGAVGRGWSGSPGPTSCLARAIWAPVEATGRSLFILLAILAIYVGLSHLVAGVPPSAALVARTIDLALDVVALAVSSLS